MALKIALFVLHITLRAHAHSGAMWCRYTEGVSKILQLDKSEKRYCACPVFWCGLYTWSLFAFLIARTWKTSFSISWIMTWLATYFHSFYNRRNGLRDLHHPANLPTVEHHRWHNHTRKLLSRSRLLLHSIVTVQAIIIRSQFVLVIPCSADMRLCSTSVGPDPFSTFMYGVCILWILFV
jgi:hypothetical protein